MTDLPQKPETDATGTRNADAAAKPAGAGAAALAAAAPKKAKASEATKEDKALKEALAAIAPLPTIVLTGPEKGRWRIGRKFTREPVSISVDKLTEAEVLALQADPELMVQFVDAPH